MRATANIAEMVTAEHNIATLKHQVQQLQELNDAWMVIFDMSVENFNGTYGIELVIKSNKKEYRERIDGVEASYIKDDIYNAANGIIGRFVGEFQHEHVMNNFLPKFSQAVKNVINLNGKKGL